MERNRKAKNGPSPLPRAALPYLRKAGWTPTRTVPTTAYEQAYAAEGLLLVPKAKQFLHEFGGLIIRYDTKSAQEDVLEFLAERAVQGMGGAGIAGFETLTRVSPLCPIGHYLFGTCMLFMDGQGRVFGCSGEAVILVGNTGEEAVVNILTGVESEVIEPRTS